MSQQSTGVHFTGGHDGYRDSFLKHAVKMLGLKYDSADEDRAIGQGDEADAGEGHEASEGARLQLRAGTKHAV